MIIQLMMKKALHKRKEKAKLITASPSSESGDSSITKLNCVNVLGKKRLNDKFYEGYNKNQNDQVPENNNSSDKESDKEVSDFLLTRKFLTFLLVKILQMNGYLKNCETEIFIQKQSTRVVLQKYVFRRDLFWNVVFLHLWSKTVKNTCERVHF